MEYIGLHTQIRRNNFNSTLLLIAFPVLLLAMIWLILFLASNETGISSQSQLMYIAPVVLTGVGIWFFIAYFFHTVLIRWATGSKPLARTENKRVYNLVENLCIAVGIPMPKIFVIEDDSLNAFASGVDQRTYSISLSRGIINKLTDEELEGVIAHELSHIRNRDVRLLIISIVFVGIFSFIAEMAFRGLRFSSGKSRDKGGSGIIVLVIIVITAVAYFLSLLLRFGISRNREYLADAGAAEMTKKPEALANALRKISADPFIEAVESRDVAQLFIDHPKPSSLRSSWDNMFATHPPIEKRIEYLEQFF